MGDFRKLRFAKTPINEYLSQILPSSLASQYLDFHHAHPQFECVCAGARHHHWWPGGLSDHTREVIGIALDVFHLYRGDLSSLTATDVIVSAYLHDFSKIWAYRRLDADERASGKYHPQQQFAFNPGALGLLDYESRTLLELARFGIVPTDQQWSAVLFAEGGWAKANFGFGGKSTVTGEQVFTRNPLAVLVHFADLFSASVLGKSLA